MIPYKWPLATAIPQSPAVRREIAKALFALVDDEDEQMRQRRAEIASIRQGLAEIAHDIAKFRRDAPVLISSELRKYGYNPEEPRIPKHSPGGGEWTRVAGDASRQILSDGAPENTWVPGARYAVGWEHHYVPWGTFDKFALQPQTRRVFVDATSGPLADTSVNRWSKEHAAYNDAVDEAFFSYLKRNNIPIDQTERLTPAQAEEFLDEVFYSGDPRIRSFNMRILA